jgi:hypothetical protein
LGAGTDEKGLVSNRNWFYAESGKTENLKIWIYAEENGHKIPNMHKAALWYRAEHP